MKKLLSVALSVSFLASCRTSENPDGNSDLASDRRHATNTYEVNAFGFELYMKLADASKYSGTNLFISPASISTAFGMTYLGAEGSTRDEMAKVLRISTDQDQAGSSYKKQLDNLRATKPKHGYDLFIANKIWTAADIKFEKSFTDSTQKFFDSEATPVMFKSSSARKQAIKDINQWASDNTNKRITEIVDDQFIKPEMSVVLANAVYFLGDWLFPFSNHGTPIKIDWTRADKKMVKAIVMSEEMQVNYVGTDDYQAVELPYRAADGMNPRISMVIVLPGEKAGLSSIDSLLSDQAWNAMTQSMNQTEVRVTIPKWEVKGESIKLKEFLIAMGMKAAWQEYNPANLDGTANFSRMSKDRSNVSLSEALHKTFVKVDEKGTEAAAVTVVGGVRATSIRPQPISFVANRPFLYAIRDMKSGEILFLGRMLDPNSAQ